jgi:P4 family phage/plasmid primase-like protien
VSVIGHADRAGPLHDYFLGLVLPGERKSVEPMAAITAPGRTAAQHQSLLHFVGAGGWSDDIVLGKVREMVLPKIESYGPVEAWIIDDTSYPKKGQHSVGVSHQYCGQLGKQANCQVAVTLSLANHDASLPVAYRLYLPKAWAEDDDRRCKAKVPEDIVFKTKPEIALDHIRWAHEIGLPGKMVLMDAGYGNDSKLRAGATELGLAYVGGIQPQTLVWKPGVRPGRPQKKGRRDTPNTTSVKELALSLKAKAWRTVKWREGANEWPSSRFARVRVHVASSHERSGKLAKEWLLIEWPEGEDEPTKYWLSTLPSNITFREEKMFMPYGPSNGGKSTMWETFADMMGDYAISCDSGLLMAQKDAGGATPERARLPGARLVLINETADDKILNEATVKHITSQDRVAARKLYKDPFDFVPSHKTVLRTNHLPLVRDADEAIWRRIEVIPFTHVFENPDRSFKEKFVAERPGMLNWTLVGLADYRRRGGLSPPAAVCQATKNYRDDMDVLGEWLNRECEADPTASTLLSTLYTSYTEWIKNETWYLFSKRRFGRELKDRGYEKVVSHGQTVIRGLKLKLPIAVAPRVIAIGKGGR